MISRICAHGFGTQVFHQGPSVCAERLITTTVILRYICKLRATPQCFVQTPLHESLTTTSEGKGKIFLKGTSKQASKPHAYPFDSRVDDPHRITLPKVHYAQSGWHMLRVSLSHKTESSAWRSHSQTRGLSLWHLRSEKRCLPPGEWSLSIYRANE